MNVLHWLLGSPYGLLLLATRFSRGHQRWRVARGSLVRGGQRATRVAGYGLDSVLGSPTTKYNSILGD